MSVQVTWDNSGRLPEKTIIYWLFEESWDWNDFSEADKCAFDMAMEMAASHKVHSLIDFRASKHIPASGAISYFTRSIQKAPPNRGTVAVVGAPSIIRAMERVLRLLSPNAADQYGYQFVETPEEAYVLFENHHQHFSSPPPA